MLLILSALPLTGCYATSRLLSSRNAVKVFSNPQRNSDRQLLLANHQVDQTPRQFRIGAYNIAHGRGNGSDNWQGGDKQERKARLQEIARFLKSSDLDVVVLNEVDFDSTWSHGVNQAEFLAAEADYPYRVEQRNFDVAAPFYKWRFGNAVLSRHPISQTRRLKYPAYARWESTLAGQKNGVVCTIDLPEGQQIRVLPVHLSHRSESVRIASAKVIAEERNRSGPPLIAIGDFNSTPVDYPRAETDRQGRTALSWLLYEGGFSASVPTTPAARQLTFPSTSPNRAIDWILVDERLQVVSQTVPAIELSDHRPIIGVVELMQQ